MKKRLLTLGALALAFSASAQFVNYVGDGATIYSKKNSTIFAGGNIKTVGTGLLDVSGDVKVTGGVTTLTASGANKVEGDREGVVLRLNDVTGFKHYGQLWVGTADQAAIPGIVAKEYRDASHGKYQQMGIPFFDKTFSTLNTELLGVALTDVRFVNRKASGENVLAYNNKLVVDDLKTLAQKTNNATEYYIIGTKNLAADYFSSTTSTIKGRPYASGVSRNLSGAGASIDFKGGEAQNIYRQKYKNYLYDAWEASTPWQGTFGRNIYQYANPFLTNIDLTLLPQDVISKIKGIRYDMAGTSTNMEAAITSKYVSFVSGTNTPVGDVNVAIIKPMQEIAIKLKEGQTTDINFDNLRTFSYTAKNNIIRQGDNPSTLSVRGNGSGRLSNPFTNSTVKQLEVVALNANKEEIDRTYFVVYSDAITGGTDNQTVQVAANSKNFIGTFEELPEGGVDPNFKDSYWLYINEANENTFKGKQIPLGIFSDEIKYIQFNIRENAELVGDGVSKLSSGESFYIKENNNIAKALANGNIIPVPTSKENIGLYYGKPATEVVDTNIVSIDKPSATIVVFDTAQNNYKVLFDKEWKKAKVSVYDLSGRVISTVNNIDTANDYTLTLPAQKAVYVVEAVSETGKKYVQKIKY